VSAVRSLIGGIVNRAPVAFASRGFSVQTGLNRGNPTGQMAAMGSVGTLFAIVSRLANATSQVQWHLYRKAPPGTPPEERVEVTRHLALDVWTKPNAFYTRQELVESVEQHIDLTGEGWFIVAKNRNLPMELWPVRPDRIAPVPSPTDFLAGYVYTDPDGAKIPLAVDEVIQIRVPNPLDPYRGMGPVQSVLADLDSSRYSAEWNRNFFLNSAEPGGIIQVDKRLSDEEFDEMTTRWREQHQGIAQAHRVAVLEQGTWIDRKFTQRDMQFTELRQLSSEMIREAFGFPKPMLGTVEDVNRANAEAAEVVFARWLIVPRLERFKQALNADFLPMFGGAAADLEFDYDSPVPEDELLEQTERTSKVNAYVALTDAGVEPEDAADIVGLPQMRHKAPVIPAPSPAPEQAPPDPGQGNPAEPGDGTADASMRRRILDTIRARFPTQPRAAAPTPPSPPAGIPGTLPAGAGPDTGSVQSSWEAALAAILAAYPALSEKQQERIVDQIRHAVVSGDVLALAGVHADSTDAAASIEAVLVAIAADAAQQVVSEAADQDVAIPTGHVARHSLAAVAQVTAATLATGLALSAVREALRVWGPGSSADDVAEQVGEHLASLTDAQPRLVLGGALSQAQNAGRSATMLAGPSAALYADEVNDKARCGPCSEVNRRWLGNSDDPAQPWLDMYPARGYVDCLGGDRCRGLVVAVWRGGSDWTKWIEKPAPRGGA
jgi:HK97 family phage portal protein